MIRKTIVASAIAGLLTLGAAPTAAAQAQPPTPQWIPVFYFGTQTYCMKAGALGEQTGVLTPGGWKCDSGWLMVQPPAKS
ncbi:hypothetical protein [Actinophytocola glycyrrhizae]|uniref:Secreted protein n=1 Tax=Actinophytocola glycyrrhizae TaxID=2044873 RepID=A0ABV9RVW5_9PSEU